MNKIKKYTVKESISGRMCYYYSIEAESEEQAMHIYRNTYPSSDEAEFFPDYNGDNHTEIQED